MGALRISRQEKKTKSTINQEEFERREPEEKVAASHKIETSADAFESVTIKSCGGNFHMPSTMTDRGESRAQSNASTTAIASRTMPLVRPPQQRAAEASAQRQQQPHNTIKLSNLSPASSAAAAARQPSYNHNHHHHQHHSFMKTTTTNNTTSTTTAAASLVYQIVIISLILHELPPLSSSTSSYQTTSCCRGGLVAASLHSKPANRQQQQAGHVEPRHKRHLAAATSHERQQVDCHKLSSMWQYLHTSYPALASHLLEWSSQTTAGKQADERFLWARSTQAARSIGHLLEEAERLTASSSMRPTTGDSEHQRQLAGAAWLARVSTNPAYARLVQHLRAKQMQQQQQHKHSTLSSGEPGGGGGRKAGAGNGSGNGNDAPVSTADNEEEQADEQMAVAASSPAAASPGATYGRLVHYPHEIGNTDNSHGMARTLDKLRLLSHHNRQQQQQQNSVMGGDRDIEETNRIPLATDVDQMTESDWRRLGESATDAARQNFVYGQVLLRPSSQTHQEPQQAQDSQQQQGQQQPQNRGHHHYQRPLEVLQGLQHEQERQRVAAAAVGGGGHETTPPSGGGGSTKALDTGFGRIVSGPQMADDAAGNNNNNDKSAQHKHAATTLAEQRQQAQRIDELRAESSDTDYRAASNGGDELANQQRFQTMAVVETRPSESNGGGGDADFDELGVFHNSPLDKPEVRLLRSAPTQQPPEPVLAKTSNNLNFVVD